MPADAIFRIYFMTKPIATVAAMILVEEGKPTLEAPAARNIPEFTEMQVGVKKARSGEASANAGAGAYNRGGAGGTAFWGDRRIACSWC